MSVAKATQAMTQNTAPPASNMDTQRQGFFDQCAQFGTNAGAGDTSKVGWFQATVEAAWQGIVAPSGRRRKGDTTSPKSDAEMAYTSFAEARKKKAGELGKRIAGADGKDFKIRVSEANRMITLGSLPLIHDTHQGGLGVFNRTLKIIREDDEIKGQVDDMLLEVARRQCDEPEKPLTNDQIKSILAPDDEDEAAPKAEVERWGSVLKSISKIRDDFPSTAGVNSKAKTVQNQVAAIVDDLGGTQAMNRAREKAREQEAKAKADRQVQRQGARKKKR